MAITKRSISGSEKSVPAKQRTLPAGFIAPCLPTKTDKLPSGSQWLHEIKHDGFRVIARKTGERVRPAKARPAGIGCR
jgi:ATP-dependent DNA ligase